MNIDILRGIEWQEPINDVTLKNNIRCIVGNEKEEQDIDSLKIKFSWNEDEYKLRLNIHNYMNINENDVFDDISKNFRIGEIISPLTFYADDLYNCKNYKLEHCYLGNSSIKLINEYGIEKKEKCTDLRCYKIIKSSINYDPNDVEILTEWFLNGPHSIIWSRLSERVFYNQYIVKGRGINEKQISEKWNSSSWDSSLISLKNFSFIIKQVPKELGPKWSSNIAIEYSKELGGIPSKKIRKSISIIISYIFGNELINIGNSKFNNMRYPIQQSYINTIPSDIKKICSNGSVSPIRNLDMHYPNENMEVFIGDIVEKYLNLNEVYELDKVMSIYWLSKRQPLGYGTPMLANGIETLSKKWFKSNKTKTSGVYMKKKVFEELLSDCFSNIETKLDGNQYSERILGKIKRTYNMGVNERLEVFLEEIGLNVSEGEKRAIKFRNTMVHDNPSYEDIGDLLSLSKSYEVFFNRVFLKILEYEGRYIDFTLTGPNGYIEKNIDIPLGE